MKVSTSLFVLTASSLAAACGSGPGAHEEYIRRRDLALGKRQAATTTGPAATPTSAVATTPAGTAGPVPTTPTLPGTYIPSLEQLTMGGPIESELPMFSTYAAGATPPVSGVVPLPTIAIVASNYPALDVVPAVDSPEVKQWLSEIDLTKVPNLSTTVDGSCASDPAAAADTSRCWWTCGGCMRETDISSLTLYLSATLTNEQIVAELGWTRKAIKDVIGVSPNTMRPPYGDIDDRVRAVAAAMGLTPVLWTSAGGVEFDTKDWRIAGGTANGTSSFAAWKSIVEKSSTIDTGFITLQHDLYQESTDMAVGYIVPDALTHQPPFHLKPIVECLGKTLENAYAESDGVPDKGAAGSPGGISASIGGSAAASRSATATGANTTGGSSGSGNNLVTILAPMVPHWRR
ncbi:chitin deacetylase [Tulasnella sp. 418]|nr:chitin deacetylase [Tulasnella sp. 418]